MNLKEWIFLLFLSLGISYGFQYFFGNKFKEHKDNKNNNESGQSFKAPQNKKNEIPLNFDFCISDKINKDINSQLTVVNTKLGQATFSSKGAILNNFNFNWNERIKSIGVLGYDSEYFWLSFADNTAIDYKLISEKKIKIAEYNATELKYLLQNKEVEVYKTFIIYDDLYKIDLLININFSKEEADRSLRVVFSNPVMQPVLTSDELFGFINSGLDSKYSSLKLLNFKNKNIFEEYFVEPKIFGFYSRFLISSLVSDLKNNLNRSYFVKNRERYYAVLEILDLKKDTNIELSFYLGPKILTDMKAVAPSLIDTLNYGYFAVVSKPMLYILNILDEKVDNYGIAIIILTILIKILLLPFTFSSGKKMKKVQEFQKKMAYIKQKYKDDKESLNRESAELIKKHGLTGGMASTCLPSLINLPIFIALNKVLTNSIELYGSKFLWIQNLAMPDPYYILGICTVIAMIFSMSSMADDAKGQLTKFSIALIVGGFTMYLSAGLALFILINFVTSALQTAIQKRFFE